MTLIPFVLFWVLLFLGRHELGLKWTLILIAVWVGALAGLGWATFPYKQTGLLSYVFAGVEAIIDIGLVLYIFKGDVRSWGR
ncbi:MAG: hypothetical protein NTX87_09890 [Planctomycetota bacterium]|nr:hypothetical protein [Planctomycetota bacterium]